MRSLFLIVGCVILGATMAQATAPAVPAPRFTVNLDLAPKDRWTAISTAYKVQINAIVDVFKKLIPKKIQDALLPILRKVDDVLPQPYADEIKSVATATGIDVGIVTIFNLIYDITAGCTSIVAQTSTGQILHARNLDYSLPGLRNITIQVDYVRNGSIVYTATHFAGYVGVLTGMRPGGFSITVDERDRDATGSFIDNILEALKGGQSIGFFLREVLEKQTSFQNALSVLQHTHLMAPVYLIIAGTNPGEGAVITRDREEPKDSWFLDAPSLWNLVETNYDHWLPSGDDRAATAMKGMATMSMSNVTLQGMYTVISTPPVLNKGTQYSILMNPSTGYNAATIRWDASPHVAAPGHLARFFEKLQMESD